MIKPKLALSMWGLTNKNNNELCHLRGTIALKVTFKKAKFNNFSVGYAESDCGGNESDRTRKTGYIFKLFESDVMCCNTRSKPLLQLHLQKMGFVWSSSRDYLVKIISIKLKYYINRSN